MSARKITEDMLVRVVMGLPAGRRQHKAILSELHRLYNINVSRSVLSEHMHEWGILAAVEAGVRHEEQSAVAASLAAIPMGQLSSQIGSLNRVEGVIDKMLSKAESALADLDVMDLKATVVLLTKTEELMRASSQVRKDMADIAKAVNGGEGQQDAPPPSGENVVSLFNDADMKAKFAVKK